MVTEILRAAMVVFDDFEGVPVTVTQSPAANELTASVTDLENVVVPVQLTAVWPVLAFCTSIVVPGHCSHAPAGAGRRVGGGGCRRLRPMRAPWSPRARRRRVPANRTQRLLARLG